MDVTTLLQQRIAKLPPEKRDAVTRLLQQRGAPPAPPQVQQPTDLQWLHAWCENVNNTLTQHARTLDELRATVAALRRDLGG